MSYTVKTPSQQNMTIGRNRAMLSNKPCKNVNRQGWATYYHDCL